jgi:VCBS repeat-containing protein
VTGKLAYDPDGNNSAQNPYVFAQLAPGLALTASDFLIEANQAPEVHPDTFDILFTGSQVSRVISAGQNDFDLDGNMSIVRMALQGGSFQNVPQGGLSPTVIVGTYGSMIAGGIGVPIDYVLSATDPDTQAIALGQTVFETFVYEASDGALTAQTTITIAITRGTAAASMAVVEAKTDGRGSDFAAAPDSAFQGAPAGEDASAAGNARAHLDHLASSDFWVAYA